MQASLWFANLIHLPAIYSNPDAPRLAIRAETGVASDASIVSPKRFI
jgi:hypothetical protein